MTTSADDGLTWTNATTMAVAKPGTGTLGSSTVVGLSRGFALYNQSLPSKTRLVMQAETGAKPLQLHCCLPLVELSFCAFLP